MLEKDLQSQCLRHIRDLHAKGHSILAINQHGSAFSSRGVPDILMCIKGKFVAVELKVGTNKPTPLQLEFIARIKDAGGEAWVMWDYETFKEVVHLALYQTGSRD